MFKDYHLPYICSYNSTTYKKRNNMLVLIEYTKWQIIRTQSKETRNILIAYKYCLYYNCRKALKAYIYESIKNVKVEWTHGCVTLFYKKHLFSICFIVYFILYTLYVYIYIFCWWMFFFSLFTYETQIEIYSHQRNYGCVCVWFSICSQKCNSNCLWPFIAIQILIMLFHLVFLFYLIIIQQFYLQLGFCEIKKKHDLLEIIGMLGWFKKHQIQLS